MTPDSHLKTLVGQFLFDRKSQNMAKGTVVVYIKKLEQFCKYCDTQQTTHIE